jgi:hypothetical protein
VFLIVVIGLKFGFDFLNQKEVRVIKQYDEKIKLAKESFPIENQKAVLNFEKSVKNLKVLLENKVYTSRFLTSIASNTHKDIYFTQLSSNVNEDLVEINGIATNLTVVSQAATAFSQILDVKDVEVKNVRNVGTSVTFTLVLIVNSSFFK